MADLVQEIEIYETATFDDAREEEAASINHIFIHFSETTNISLAFFVYHAHKSQSLSY
jgi:hypothetical protein